MNALQPSRREQAKNGRRDRIVDAATDLIEEVGIEDLSVRMIADRADVSPATVYNLFRNKSAVLFRVYQRRVSLLDDRVAKTKSADTLEHIFDAAAHVCDLYRTDPGFYRAFIGLRLDVRPDNLPSREPPGVHLWRRLVRDAVAAGILLAETDSDRVGALLFRIITGAFYEWVGNALPLERVEEETMFSFAAILSTWATPPAKARLALRLKSAGKSTRLRLVPSPG